MAALWHPSTHAIRAVVSDEIAQAGGTVSDCIEDGDHLFLRSVLPAVTEVRPRDGIQGGVALMTCGEDVNVHPYVFRQICRNGAIMAQTLETLHLARVDEHAAFAIHQFEGELREAVRACLRPEVFAANAGQMRAAALRPADLALSLLSHFRGSPGAISALLPQILSRFSEDRDRSAFGLMNAVTSVARDQADPQVRWRLEEIGGCVPRAFPRGAGAPGRSAASLRCEEPVGAASH